MDGGSPTSVRHQWLCRLVRLYTVAHALQNAELRFPHYLELKTELLPFVLYVCLYLAALRDLIAAEMFVVDHLAVPDI